jgi:hypothetical protein
MEVLSIELLNCSNLLPSGDKKYVGKHLEKFPKCIWRVLYIDVGFCRTDQAPRKEEGSFTPIIRHKFPPTLKGVSVRTLMFLCLVTYVCKSSTQQFEHETFCTFRATSKWLN